MVRITLAILALGAGLVAGPAMGADQRDTVARKFGEAFAIAARCDALAVDTDRMGVYSGLLGIAVDDTFKAVVTIWKNRTLTEISEVSDADACRVGRHRYGAEGTEGPGLLKG